MSQQGGDPYLIREILNKMAGPIRAVLLLSYQKWPTQAALEAPTSIQKRPVSEKKRLGNTCCTDELLGWRDESN